MHHAYYIEDSLSAFDAYHKLLKPFWAKKFERFGIDDARDLVALAYLKNTGETIFFIAASGITTEAQQALLKLFEEPQRGTTFVLLVPHGSLIATLRSRMLAYPGAPAQGGSEFAAEAKKFLRGPQKERSAAITAMLKDDEEVKERVRGFLNALEEVLYAALQKNPKKEIREGLSDIAHVRSYLGDRSPALKMLLEHLALSLPAL